MGSASAPPSSPHSHHDDDWNAAMQRGILHAGGPTVARQYQAEHGGGQQLRIVALNAILLPHGDAVFLHPAAVLGGNGQPLADPTAECWVV